MTSAPFNPNEVPPYQLQELVSSVFGFPTEGERLLEFDTHELTLVADNGRPVAKVEIACAQAWGRAFS